MKKFLEDAGIGYINIGEPAEGRILAIEKNGQTFNFDIDALRDVWYKSSFLLDQKQSFNGKAAERYQNYKQQPIEWKFLPDFTGKLSQYGLNPDRRHTCNRCLSTGNGNNRICHRTADGDNAGR